MENIRKNEYTKICKTYVFKHIASEKDSLISLVI